VKVAGFIKEVKLEASKIAWPTRREAVLSCVLVLVMAAISGVFFLLIDTVVYKTIQFLLGI
jgi:preprotein translocase subunit SecE